MKINKMMVETNWQTNQKTKKIVVFQVADLNNILIYIISTHQKFNS